MDEDKISVISIEYLPPNENKKENSKRKDVNNEAMSIGSIGISFRAPIMTWTQAKTWKLQNQRHLLVQ